VDEVFINTSSQDIVTSSVTGMPNATWVAIGAGGSNLTVGTAIETSDSLAQSLQLNLDGVDQSIIAILGNNFFRGQPIDIWRAWLSRTTGQVSANFLLFSGLQNEEYTITEVRPEGLGSRGTCDVTTRLVSRLAYMQYANSVLTNVDSHNKFLQRVGVNFEDRSFKYVGSLVNRDVLWGVAGRSFRPPQKSR
jgi:hypothetical protein